MTENHRQWQPGQRLMDRGGYFAKLLTPTWETYAWVLYDGQTTPCTVNAHDLTPAHQTVSPHYSCY